MLKKIFVTLACAVVLIGAGGYLFKAQLWETFQRVVTTDMFVAGDTDSFDPGLAVGQSFPAIKALYQGQSITSTREFVHDKGMVFIANRSADW